MSLSPDGKYLYVANNLNYSASRIDLATGQIAATVPVGKMPYAAVLSRDGSALYVSNWGESSVSVVDTKDFAVKKDDRSRSASERYSGKSGQRLPLCCQFR